MLNNLLDGWRDRGDQALCEQARMAVFRQRLAFEAGRDEAGALLQTTQCTGKLVGHLFEARMITFFDREFCIMAGGL